MCYCQSSHNLLLVCGSQVLRSYDTRFRATQRKPDLYTKTDQGKSAIFPDEEIAEQVLSIEDGNKGGESDDVVLEFGETTSVPDENVLWSCKTKLLVIATPYREGQHVATKPSEFVPIINHLQYLHAKGYVHGDIRCFNMILKPNSEYKPNDIFETANDGCLIDFDFGGNSDGAKYPFGYKQVLHDGSRCGKGNEPIKLSHDWYALGMLIFSCYRFVKPNDLDKEKWVDLLERKEILGDLISKNNFDGTDVDIANLLRKFLIDTTAEGYTMRTTGSFKLYMRDTQVGSTHMATGSPPKEKM